MTTKKISQIQKRQSNQNNNGELQRWEIMPNLFTEVAIMAGRVRVWIHWQLTDKGMNKSEINR